MYVKVKDGKVEKFPYSATDLIHDNKGTSFPKGILSDDLLKSWDVYKVVEIPIPEHNTSTHKVVPKEPVLERGSWMQRWDVVPLSAEEKEEQEKINSALRLQMYRDISDPLFFKVQAGEATLEEWIAKREEIKNKYPE